MGTRDWQGDSGCTFGRGALAELARTAGAIEGDVLGRLDDPDTALHELIAWAWVVDPSRTQILLVRHPERSKWTVPGGRVEGAEHPRDAAARELREETGVAGRPRSREAALVDVVDHPLPDGRPASSFGVAYCFEVDPEHVVLRPEPGQPARWWPRHAPPVDVVTHQWERVQRFCRLQG